MYDLELEKEFFKRFGNVFDYEDEHTKWWIATVKLQRVALLDKAIEELEGEKIKYEVGKPFCISCRKGSDDYFNQGISTAISHLTNLRDSLTNHK